MFHCNVISKVGSCCEKPFVMPCKWTGKYIISQVQCKHCGCFCGEACVLCTWNVQKTVIDIYIYFWNHHCHHMAVLNMANGVPCNCWFALCHLWNHFETRFYGFLTASPCFLGVFLHQNMIRYAAFQCHKENASHKHLWVSPLKHYAKQGDKSQVPIPCHFPQFDGIITMAFLISPVTVVIFLQRLTSTLRDCKHPCHKLKEQKFSGTMHIEDLEIGPFFWSNERMGGYIPSFKWYISLCFVEVYEMGFLQPVCDHHFFHVFIFFKKKHSNGT